MVSVLTIVLITLAIITRSALLGYSFMIFATIVGISYTVDVIRWKRGNHTK